MMKAFVVILLQLPLLVLGQDVAFNETNNRDNKTQIELTSAANQVSLFQSSSLPPTLNVSSTISGIDNNSTEHQNGTLKTETTTLEPPTTTLDPQLELIPPATVVAQIIKANITTKKPSRLQAAA